MSGRMASGRGPIWRAVLWFERFLPKPAPMLSTAESEALQRRRAKLVPLFVLPAVLMPAFLRSRHELGAVLRQNIVLFQQLFVGVVIVCAIALVAAGVVTLRREAGR